MRAIMLMFDTLARDFLSNYGNDWINTPNFERLREKRLRLTTFMVAACLVCQREENFIQVVTILCIVRGDN